MTDYVNKNQKKLWGKCGCSFDKDMNWLTNQIIVII